jgi:hypothetical protein
MAFVEFKKLHPGRKGVWIFDNSTNHHAKCPNGLDAKVFPLKDGGKNIPRNMRNGWFLMANFDGSQSKVSQSMYFDNGVAKGLHSILKERGFDTKNLKLQEKTHILMNQSDFLGQKSWLEESLVDLGQIVDFVPKFHCEMNPMERIWAYAKNITRKFCTYKYDGLEEKVSGILTSVPIAVVRRFFRVAFRVMDCHRERNGLKLTPSLISYMWKRYRSHRKVPDTLLLDLENDCKGNPKLKEDLEESRELEEIRDLIAWQIEIQ